MYCAKSLKYLTAVASVYMLQACSFPPHVQDWDRNRIEEIPKGEIEVRICFNNSEHTKAEVLQVAREECVERIGEVQNRVRGEEMRSVAHLREAEGRLFAGPVDRQRRREAMIKSLKIGYVNNDVWDCPLATRNRIIVHCLYDPDAADSKPRSTQVPQAVETPDFPPELPEDLKPR